MDIQRRQQATIASIKRSDDGTYEIILKPEQPVHFVPGQYAWIIVPKLAYPDVRGNRRPFTIISTPDSEALHFVFRPNEASGFKKTLVELPIGSTITIEAPFGSHILPENEHIPVVMVAGGIGACSYLSMIRNMELRNAWRPVTLVYTSQRSPSVCMQELRSYAHSQPLFKLCEADRTSLRSCIETLRAPESTLWYISGPQEMASDTMRTLNSIGISKDRILIEEYPSSQMDMALLDMAVLAETDFFTSVVESAPNHMVFTDVDGIIQYCNRTAEKVTGYTIAEMRGSTPRLWGGLMGKEYYRNMWKTIKDERRTFSGKITNRRKDGTLYTVIAHISPVMNTRGDLIGFVGTEEDISHLEQLDEERRTLIRKLEKANDRLSSADRAKNDFIATLAHELRNPLAPVVSSLELIRAKAEATSQQELIDLAGVSVSHIRTMGRLLDDLLDISRISRRKFKLQKETIELRHAVDRAVSMTKSTYEAKQHRLSVSLPSENIWIEVDPLRFEQIIVNILNNAARYTDDGGNVSLVVTRGGERDLRITITDNGRGIERDMLEKIFDPFTQIENETTAGLGIGLSLTKRLVDLHEGSVWASSAGPNRGSTFSVMLPVIRQQPPLFNPPKQSDEIPAAIAAAEQKLRVLVIDDNHAAAIGMMKLLEHRGHAVAVAHDGTSGIAEMEHTASDAVLIDIGLPDMTGHDVAREIRERFGGKPLLIALTGYGQEEDKQESRNAGFDFHLVKPVSVLDVDALLKRHFASSNTARMSAGNPVPRE